MKVTKKLLAFILCLGFILNGFCVFAQNDVSVSMEFVEDMVEVDGTAAVKINVSGAVKKVKANIEYNNYLLNYAGEGLGFDITTGEYIITFTPSDEPYILYCCANISGPTQLTLKNVTCETDNGSINLGNITAKVTVVPKYVRIYTKEDLNNIRNDLSGAYLLMNDIEFLPEDFLEGGAFYNDGFGWIPIGAVVKEAFKGEFNGNGYTISGLTVNKAYYNYCGLFGVNHGKITSLRIKDAVIDGRIGINMSAPSGTPNINGDIDYEDKDVWTQPDDSITEESLNNYDRTGESTAGVGIICGINLGSIKNSFAQGTLMGNTVAGGIAGRNNNIISGCATSVSIKDVNVAGGIAAITSTYSNVSDCVAEGSVEAILSGAIIGTVSGKVSRVYSLCEGENIAGNFGKISGATISQSYVFGNAISDAVSEIKPIEELPDLRFDGGEWNYTKEIPYPEALSDLIKDAQAEIIQGDVNDDGAVDTSDLAALKLYLAGMGTLNEKNADLNADGKVDTVDLASLKLSLAGMN